MFKDISKFQIGLIGAFVFFVVAGIASFSLYQGGKQQDVPLVTIWGTVESSYMVPYIQQVSYGVGNKKMSVSYVEKAAKDFDMSLLEALATGNGPDVILVSQDEILKQRNKIYPLSYKTFPEATFKSAFVQEGELFLESQGIIAIPFAIDPMVMYWNRDIFTNANISLPPKRWDEFLTLSSELTKKDAAQNIIQSGVALGEYKNISHAKDILSLLIMQAGNPIVTQSQMGYQATLGSSLGNTLPPANAALTFYTQFADPLKQIYTWNRALPDSKTLFLSNKLGVYFGYASEYKELREKNPNLNFDVALMPQARAPQEDKAVLMTYGNIYGFALLKSSPRLQAAFEDVSYLTSKNYLNSWTKITGLPSVRRDAPAADPSDATLSVFSISALRARGWLDPDHVATESIFRGMIEGVTSGRELYNEAITQSQGALQFLVDKINQNNTPSQ